jgi:light-regulated signal transduction histidine kinase (bacteriophytochrome)
MIRLAPGVTRPSWVSVSADGCGLNEREVELAPRLCASRASSDAVPTAASKRGREAGDGFRPLLKVATRDLGEAVEIRVRGTGIAPEYRDKLFRPFSTTKPTGEGTGLGLSISYDIVTQPAGGTITVDGEEGAFIEFTIRLPRRGRAGPANGSGRSGMGTA